MKVKLNNQTELDVITVNGSKQFYQGETRDTLEIQLKKGIKSFDELDELFGNEENTKRLTIINDSGEFLHEHYTLRISMGLTAVEISSETAEASAQTEERITILLAQKSYRERELEEMKRMIAQLSAQKA